MQYSVLPELSALPRACPVREGVKYIISVTVFVVVVSLLIILYLQQKPCRLLWVLY